MYGLKDFFLQILTLFSVYQSGLTTLYDFLSIHITFVFLALFSFFSFSLEIPLYFNLAYQTVMLLLIEN